jgi:DNA polymerase-3 subunit epsilon
MAPNRRSIPSQPGAGPEAARVAGVVAEQTRLDGLTPLVDTTFVVLDLETTGLSPASDRITEVGAVRARGGVVDAELRTFVHPGRPIPPTVTALTGITDADVADAPREADVLPLVLRFLGDAVLVAHNARFDLGFLRAAADRLGLAPPRPAVVDTAVLARRLVRDEVRDLRLGTLARHFRVPVTPDHRALTDARATLHVLHALLERAGSHGVTAREDLLRLCGPEGDRSHRRIGLVRAAPSEPGVYRFVAADGEVLYVGRAVDLRRRLRSYFGQDTRRSTADLVAATDRVEWTVTPTELEAAVLEVRTLGALRPRYNRRGPRPDRGQTVTLTREPFPRLTVRRGPPDPAGDEPQLGPVPPATAERVVSALEAVLPLRPCRPRLRRAQDHPACVLRDIGRCAAPCDGSQSAEAYAAVVARARDVLRDPSVVLRQLGIRMRGLAADGEFERAVAAREELRAVVAAAAVTRRVAAHAGTVAVLRRDHPGGVEVVRLDGGRLVATRRLVPDASGAAVDRAVAELRALPSPPDGDDADGAAVADVTELALVAAWSESGGVRAVHVTGALALPRAGGAALARAEAVLREVARAVRADAEVLTGAKVRRRSDGLSPVRSPAPT